MATSHHRHGFTGKPFTFVHVPKTAGTAFSSAIAPFSESYEKDPDLRHAILKRSPDLLNRYQGILFWHITYDDLVSHFGGAEFSERFNFAFIRNPWDWLVSMYAFIRQHANHPESMLVNHMSFRQFLDFWVAKRVRQWDFLQHDGTVSLKLYKYEELNSACIDIADHIGISLLPLKMINASKRGNYVDYYDKQSRDLVAEHFAADIALGDYSFHSKYSSGTRLVRDRFEAGESPYLAQQIILSLWEYEGAPEAAECCDELSRMLPEIAFLPPRGDAFHIGMAQKILEGLKLVICHEIGVGALDAAQAGSLHDAVRGALWTRLWQLARRGDRPSLRRMARLYPLVCRAEASAVLQSVETFLGPHRFWDDVLSVMDECAIVNTDSIDVQISALGWRTRAELGLGRYRAAFESFLDLLELARSHEACGSTLHNVSTALEQARTDILDDLRSLTPAASKELLLRLQALQSATSGSGQAPNAFLARVIDQLLAQQPGSTGVLTSSNRGLIPLAFQPGSAGSPEHYFHFLLGYALPVIEYALRTLPTARRNRTFLLRSCGPVMDRVMDEILNTFDVPYEITAESDTRFTSAHAVRIPRWDLPLFLGSEGGQAGSAGRLEAETLHPLREIRARIVERALAEADGPNRYERKILLLKRSEEPEFYRAGGSAEFAGYGVGRRSLSGQGWLKAELEASGHAAEIYEPGAHSFFDQVRAFHACRGIVAIRGAELANMLWMPPGAFCVVFNVSKLPHWYMHHLSDLSNLTLTLIDRHAEGQHLQLQAGDLAVTLTAASK